MYMYMRPRRGGGGVCTQFAEKIKPDSQFMKKITHISHFTTKISPI